jgi:hypothetical protein
MAFPHNTLFILKVRGCTPFHQKHLFIPSQACSPLAVSRVAHCETASGEHALVTKLGFIGKRGTLAQIENGKRIIPKFQNKTPVAAAIGV